jgi:hypothetical protein
MEWGTDRESQMHFLVLEVVLVRGIFDTPLTLVHLMLEFHYPMIYHQT